MSMLTTIQVWRPFPAGRATQTGALDAPREAHCGRPALVLGKNCAVQFPASRAHFPPELGGASQTARRLSSGLLQFGKALPGAATACSQEQLAAHTCEGHFWHPISSCAATPNPNSGKVLRKAGPGPRKRSGPRVNSWARWLRSGSARGASDTGARGCNRVGGEKNGPKPVCCNHSRCSQRGQFPPDQPGPLPWPTVPHAA